MCKAQYSETMLNTHTRNKNIKISSIKYYLHVMLKVRTKATMNANENIGSLMYLRICLLYQRDTNL